MKDSRYVLMTREQRDLVARPWSEGWPDHGSSEILGDLAGAYESASRRGDTLVRAADLRLVLDADMGDEATYCRPQAEHDAIQTALGNLDAALKQWHPAEESAEPS